METINNIELRDEGIFPNEQVLRAVLEQSYDSYLELLDLFSKHSMLHEWRYYRDGKAWLCKVQKKKKTIVWMSAWRGYMQATVYFPEKHIGRLFQLDVSQETIRKIESTRMVGKFKPCTFEIRDNSLLPELEKVICLKMEL
jgi:hypothetical protein